MKMNILQETALNLNEKKNIKILEMATYPLTIQFH